MKLTKIIYLLFFIISCFKGVAQNTCATASPFCANQGAVSFPAGINGSAAAGPDYGCLLSQPNPA